jgi:hypothetical protein
LIVGKKLSMPDTNVNDFSSKNKIHQLFYLRINEEKL